MKSETLQFSLGYKVHYKGNHISFLFINIILLHLHLGHYGLPDLSWSHQLHSYSKLFQKKGIKCSVSFKKFIRINTKYTRIEKQAIKTKKYVFQALNFNRATPKILLLFQYLH